MEVQDCVVGLIVQANRGISSAEMVQSYDEVRYQKLRADLREAE
jgi:hypothetical protein